MCLFAVQFYSQHVPLRLNWISNDSKISNESALNHVQEFANKHDRRKPRLNVVNKAKEPSIRGGKVDINAYLQTRRVLGWNRMSYSDWQSNDDLRDIKSIKQLDYKTIMKLYFIGNDLSFISASVPSGSLGS